MYKVFVNDKPIIFTSSLKKEEKYPVYIIKTVSVSELIHKLRLGKYKGVYLYCNNLEKDWDNFKKEFKVISAAGGLVLNDKNEILFIYRGNKWDLPKGRIERGESVKETAIREVEEECGIRNISITNFLLNTYHLFVQDNEYRLKETYWYLMKSDYKGKLRAPRRPVRTGCRRTRPRRWSPCGTIRPPPRRRPAARCRRPRPPDRSRRCRRRESPA